MTQPDEGAPTTWWSQRSQWQKVAIVISGALIALTVLASIVGDPDDPQGVAGPSGTESNDTTTTLTVDVNLVASPDEGTTESPATDDSPTTTGATTTIEPVTTTTQPLPNYNVLATEDVSFAGAVRIRLRVTVDDGTTRGQLRAIAEEIVAEQQAEGPFQALNIFFYHYPELSQDIASLGTWDYSPYGDWGRANEAKLGDYTKHEPNDRTKEKDWSLLPSRDQIDVYVAYIEMFALMDTDPLSFPSDDDIYPAVATELGIPVSEVDAALDAIADWWFNED